MPTYEYKREDGSVFEIVQRITAPALTECPTTGQKVKRIISGGAGLVFKGTGFYQTDYARKSSVPPPNTGGSTETATSSSPSGDKKSSATPKESTPTKSNE